MNRTFEEIVSVELDALYQGALFLTAGSRPDAERLLVKSMSRAFADFSALSVRDDVREWLEERLVRSHLERADLSVGGPPESAPSEAIPSASDEVSFAPQELYRAARALPESARAVVWLVTLCRREYDDVARATGLPIEQVRELVGYREALYVALGAHPRRGDGRRSGRG